MSHTSRTHAANHRVHAAMEDAKDAVAEQAESTMGAVQRIAGETADNVRETASDLLEQGKAKAQETAEVVGTQMHDHIGSSLLIAAAIGFLAGYFVPRR